eukprot:m.68475 g.68475  ORF g.68475 m.68475 type:complete len:237 (-) comp14182_c0_seq2:1-711(-)
MYQPEEVFYDEDAEAFSDDEENDSLSKRIYVGGIPPGVSEEDLVVFFEHNFGFVESGRILTDKPTQRTYGFVTFVDQSSRDLAIHVKEVMFQNYPLSIAPAQRKTSVSRGYMAARYVDGYTSSGGNSSTGAMPAPSAALNGLAYSGGQGLMTFSAAMPTAAPGVDSGLYVAAGAQQYSSWNPTQYYYWQTADGGTPAAQPGLSPFASSFGGLPDPSAVNMSPLLPSTLPQQQQQQQ